MKNFNRRDFLKLTGLTALALTFSACGSSAAKDPKALLDSINEYRAAHGLSELRYSKALEDWAKLDMQCFASANSTSENLENWRFAPGSAMPTPEYYSIAYALLYEEGLDPDSVLCYGTEETFVSGESIHTLNKLYPETEADLNLQMAGMAAGTAGMDGIGIALVRIDGNLYWYAVMAQKSAGA